MTSTATAGMRVVVGWPPNLAAIAARFRISNNTVFAWDDVLYSPSGLEVPADVMVHDLVHQRQQREIGGAQAWWDRYLEDSEFVVLQEIPAYQRQFQFFCSRHPNKAMRTRFLRQLATDLSGPLYGRLLDFRSASTLIRGAR